MHNIKKHMPFLSAFDLAIGVSKTVRDSLPCPNKISIYNGVDWDSERVVATPSEYERVVDTQKPIRQSHINTAIRWSTNYFES